VNKKRFEQLKREIADREIRARRESEERQEEIKELWGLKKQDRPLKEKEFKELKKRKLKELLKSVRDVTENDDLINGVDDLVKLVGLQDREIDYLTKFRRDWERIRSRYPEELENLSFLIFRAEVERLIQTGAIKLPKLTPKQEQERKRSRYRWGGLYGLIEYQFGGAGEAEWRKTTFSGVVSLVTNEPYPASCLDEIFAGGGVNTSRLQSLFGMDRNRFPKELPSVQKGRERRYAYRAVVKIMDALLTQNDCQNETQARGRPYRIWLCDLNARTRVLGGIEARLTASPWPKHVKAAFLRVVRRHLRDSAKK
jgi:hypothetical protein